MERSMDIRVPSEGSESDEAFSDDDSHRPPQRSALPTRLPLHQFLRIIAGGRMVDHGAATSNAELVESLRRAGILESERSTQALLACPRDHFISTIAHGAYRDEALFDSPIRIEEFDFNISAPHMHATCLEALELCPGCTVLDVGSGCGVLTAAIAHAVGKTGRVVGIDIRNECIQMGRESVDRLLSCSEAFSSVAGPIVFERLNVFLCCSSSHHIGAYDRVHVGAACPPEREKFFLDLLKPEGGIIVVPVIPSDLRVIIKHTNGTITEKIISQVRFSELEIPSDAQVLLASLKAERKARHNPRGVCVPSTYQRDLDMLDVEDDVVHKEEHVPHSPSFVGGLPGSFESGRSSWPFRLGNYLKVCSTCSTPTSVSPENRTISPRQRPISDLLSHPDTMLVGPEWQIPAHQVLLKHRCEHFRARCEIGMRDSGSSLVTVPEHFSKAAVEAFVHYLYHDTVPVPVSEDPEAMVALLYVSQYYGTPHLSYLCEVNLAKILLQKQSKDVPKADTAAALLELAVDLGLSYLKTVALDYIVHNYDAVSKTKSFESLGRNEIELVASEATTILQRLILKMKDMADQ